MKVYEISHQIKGYFMQNLNQVIKSITHISKVCYTIFFAKLTDSKKVLGTRKKTLYQRPKNAKVERIAKY